MDSLCISYFRFINANSSEFDEIGSDATKDGIPPERDFAFLALRVSDWLLFHVGFHRYGEEEEEEEERIPNLSELVGAKPLKKLVVFPHLECFPEGLDEAEALPRLQCFDAINDDSISSLQSEFSLGATAGMRFQEAERRREEERRRRRLLFEEEVRKRRAAFREKMTERPEELTEDAVIDEEDPRGRRLDEAEDVAREVIFYVPRSVAPGGHELERLVVPLKMRKRRGAGRGARERERSPGRTADVSGDYYTLDE